MVGSAGAGVVFDRHHLIHTRSDWTSNKTAKRLRDTPELVPRIDRQLHNEIHRQAPAVPLLGYHALYRVSRDFETAETSWESLENLMRVIEQASRSPKSHRIESQLALLAVESLDIQRVILKSEGI